MTETETNEASLPAPPKPRHIASMEIVDFDMPFCSMVVFLLKFAVAFALVSAFIGLGYVTVMRVMTAWYQTAPH